MLHKKSCLYLPAYYARVLGKMGEFEGEPRERLSSLRCGKAGPFLPQAATRRRPGALQVSTAEQRGFFPLKPTVMSPDPKFAPSLRAGEGSRYIQARDSLSEGVARAGHGARRSEHARVAALPEARERLPMPETASELFYFRGVAKGAASRVRKRREEGRI